MFSELIKEECQDLTKGFPEAWDRFWFAPSSGHLNSLFRIGIALFALSYQLLIAFRLNAWFGETGLISPDVMAIYYSDSIATQIGEKIFLFNYTGIESGLWVGWGFGVVVTLCLVLGIFSRVSAILTLWVILSYSFQGMLLRGHHEPVLCFLLLYLCIAPGGRYFSIDRGWKGKKSSLLQDVFSDSLWHTFSLRLMQVHLAAFYGMMAAGKLMGFSWWEGEALNWISSQPEWGLVDLTFLSIGREGNSTAVSNFFTHTIVAYEFAMALLIWYRPIRLFLILGSIPYWISIWLLTGLTTFSFLMLLAGFAFLLEAIEAQRKREA
ncbi:MAG: hypothetical protein MPJ24_04150 [Pirellulaceae bacterium]|nr:hypothetical protein [Pirellulaceae bacterium]